MRKIALIAAIFILVALLLTSPSPVRASPELILEPGFETIDNWTYSEPIDPDFTDGAQSSAWANRTGNSSYLFSAAAADIAKDAYCQILQSVDFTSIDTISFDTYLYADSPDYSARMLVGAAEVWTQAVPEVATEYMHQEVDVSGYTGSQDLIFRIYAVGNAPNSTMNCYFDNIKPWGSYSNPGRTAVSNDFTTFGAIVYMYGENFDTTGTYKVGYYDGGTAHDGVDGALLQTDTYTNGAGGVLAQSQCRPADYSTYNGQNASYGTWHAVVYKTGLDMPDSYNLVSKGDTAYAVADSFTVEEACIPEFPTVFAAVGVGGLCFGIYWRLKKRMRPGDKGSRGN